LRRPDLKLIDVALESGYQDPANFTRAFRRWAGVSPTDYRRKAGGAR
jgi:AraC-like DNA-binding protein